MDQLPVKFTIIHMDTLGQGVSREGGITFIEKVLPGEQGTAVIYRQAKGVRFAKVLELTLKSSLRIKPECLLYDQCGGCQYLHTSYKNEINYKHEALLYELRDLIDNHTSIKIYPAKKRVEYRNRIQIHYRRKTGQFGYVSKYFSALIPVDGCLLPSEVIQRELKNLYKNDRWKSLIPENSPESGICEIYLPPGAVKPKISWNRPYADGGFSQINETMNYALRNLVKEAYTNYSKFEKIQSIFDIFGGDGNLTQNLLNTRITVIDAYVTERVTQTRNSSRIHIKHNLYKKDALPELQIKLKDMDVHSPGFLIFDPPRKGVTNIKQWITTFPAPFVFYISCNAATFKRDAAVLKKLYTIEELNLIDLFPGTRHFETFAVFKKKGNFSF